MLFVLIPLLVCSGADAGDLMRFTCAACNKSATVMLGRGRLGTVSYQAMICRGKTARIVGLPYGTKHTAGCPGGLTPLNFVEGMACPICPTGTLEKRRAGFWD